MKGEILKYLGYTNGFTPDEATSQLIDKALQLVAELSSFKYIYAEYETPLPFMNHKAYQEYLSGSKGFLLCATTLGIEIDRKLKRLQLQDMAFAVIFDAAASVYLETKADEFEHNLPYQELGFRFCPGYSGTPLCHNRVIAECLHSEQIGISFMNSDLMLPMKSMVGIIKIGGSTPKDCGECVAKSECVYRKRGIRCYTI